MCEVVAKLVWYLGRERFEKDWCEEYGKIPYSDVDAFLELFPENAHLCTVEKQPYFAMGYPQYTEGHSPAEWRSPRPTEEVIFDSGADVPETGGKRPIEDISDVWEDLQDIINPKRPNIGTGEQYEQDEEMDAIAQNAVNAAGSGTGGGGGQQKDDGYYNTAGGRCKKWTCQEKCEYKKNNPIKPCWKPRYKRRYYKKTYYKSNYKKKSGGCGCGCS